MKITTAALKIEGYGTYQKPPHEGGGDMTYKSGQTVDYVEIRDVDSGSVEGGMRRFTLERSINGDRPAAGTVQVLTLVDYMEPDARPDGRGGAYVTRKRRNLVTAFTPAKS